MSDQNTHNKANIKCPYCEYVQEVDIPQSSCLVFYKCENCGKTVSVPEDSQNCCVICEYSDTKCPAGKN